MNEKIKPFIANNWIMLAIVACILGAIIWFYTFHVSDNSRTIKQLRDELDGVKASQQRTTEYIERAEDRLNNIEGTVNELSTINQSSTDTVNRIEERTSNSEGLIQRSNDAIGRSQQIIDEIRKGSQGDAK